MGGKSAALKHADLMKRVKQFLAKIRYDHRYQAQPLLVADWLQQFPVAPRGGQPVVSLRSVGTGRH